MMENRSQNSFSRLLPLPLLRTISIALIVTMTIGDPSWAAGMSDLYQTHFSTDLSNLSIPMKFGEITERKIVPSLSKSQPPLVVLIQDLHANVSVQNNIAGIIEYLYHRFHIASVFTEAAFGHS